MICDLCISNFEGFCIENEEPIREEGCECFIDKMIAETMCELMCPEPEFMCPEEEE